MTALLALSACAPDPPKRQMNVCSMFRTYPSWYWQAEKSRRKWGLPVSVQMAILHQESHFQANVLPPPQKLVGIITWKRASTAEGYTQALDDTWKQYLKETKQVDASRTDFGVSVDFVGWFSYRAHKDLGISSNNAYDLYLAYHEGEDGYKKRSYLHKRWLMHIARNVQYTANHYRTQLIECESNLPKYHWWRFSNSRNLPLTT